MFFSNNQPIEFSGRKFNELCERRDVVISKLNEELDKNIITIDEYNDWCIKLYSPNFNQETLIECSLFTICGKSNNCQNENLFLDDTTESTSVQNDMNIDE